MTATLYSNFIGQIVSQIAISQNIGLANTGRPQRKWRIPSLWELRGDPLDIPGMEPPYDRSDINEAYQIALTDGVSKTADAMAIKLQLDHVGSQERAFRMRQASSIRLTMHAANRRLGHAALMGLHDRMANHAVDMIVSGSAGDP